MDHGFYPEACWRPLRPVSDFLKHKGNPFGPKRSIPNLQTTRETRNSAKQENPHSNAFGARIVIVFVLAMWGMAWETFGTNRKRWITFFIAYWRVNKILVTILESCGSRYQLELQSISSWIRTFLKFYLSRIEIIFSSSSKLEIRLHSDFLMC